MLKQDQIEALRAPFPAEALSSDTSRGFELTSIKAAYVIERLNEVFGPCGIGWRYVHSPFDVLPTGNGREEIVTEVALQYRFPATNDCALCLSVSDAEGPPRPAAAGAVLRQVGCACTFDLRPKLGYIVPGDSGGGSARGDLCGSCWVTGSPTVMAAARLSKSDWTANH